MDDSLTNENDTNENDTSLIEKIGEYWSYDSKIDVYISILNLLSFILSIIILVELSNTTDAQYLFWIFFSFMIAVNIIFNLLFVSQFGFDGNGECFNNCYDITIFIFVTLTISVSFPVIVVYKIRCGWNANNLFIGLSFGSQIIISILILIFDLLIINTNKNSTDHSILIIEIYTHFIVNLIVLIITIYYMFNLEEMVKISELAYYLKMEFVLSIIIIFIGFTIDYNTINILGSVYIVIAMCLKSRIIYKYIEWYEQYGDTDWFNFIICTEYGISMIDKICIIDAISNQSSLIDQNESFDDWSWTINHAMQYKTNSMDYFKTLYSFTKTDIKQKKRYLYHRNILSFKNNYVWCYLSIFMLYVVALGVICFIIASIDISDSSSKLRIFCIDWVNVFWFIFSSYKTSIDYPLESIRMAMLLRHVGYTDDVAPYSKLCLNCTIVAVFDYFPSEIAYNMLSYIIDHDSSLYICTTVRDDGALYRRIMYNGIVCNIGNTYYIKSSRNREFM